MTRTVHPIELESYRILRERVDLARLPPLSRAVAERIIHASADLEYARTLILDEDALESGRAALAAGAPLIVDARMVAVGITARESWCPLTDPDVPALADAAGITRSAAAFRIAAQRTAAGAVWVVGNAPTALLELLERPPAAPALVVGLPVGFVGAAEAKAALSRSSLPLLTNRGEKGGSAVAAAAINALLYSFDKEPAA
jgi:precorrin-8X/cobalt-precorrin-8 methylmutase